MIKRILNPDSAWETSTFSDIPSLPESASETIRHFCIVAGGLALILSRNRDAAIDRHYAHAAEMYALLGRELRKYGKTSANAELINNVMHEVAEVADPLTMASLKKCLEFRRRHDANRGQSRHEDGAGNVTQPSGSGFHSRLGLRTRTSRVAAQSMAMPDSDIQALMRTDAAPDGNEAAQRLKQTLEQARRRRQELGQARSLRAPQSSSDGKATSSL